MENTTGVQFDDDKDEEGAKHQVMDNGEIISSDVQGVVLQEGFPGLVSGRSWSELVEVLLDGAFADVDTRFEQFTPNAFRTPQPVFLSHLFQSYHNFSGVTNMLQTKNRAVRPRDNNRKTQFLVVCGFVLKSVGD